MKHFLIKLKQILFIFFLLRTSLCISQEYNYIHYTNKDGLAGNTVYGVAQDKDGYMFFATENGLSRFDGKEWKTFTVKDGLPDNEILTIYADSKGRVWMGQYNKALCFYYKGIIHNANNDSILSKIKLNSIISTMHEIENGDMVFSSSDLVFSITNDDRFLLVINNIDPSVSHSVGNLFTNKNLIDSGALISYRGFFCCWYKNYVAYKLNKTKSDSIRNLTPISRFFQNIRYKFRTPFYNSKVEIVNTIDKISRSECYVNTSNGTWIVTSSNMDSNKHFLAGLKIGHTLKDREGNYWFSTMGNGVFKTSSDKIKTFIAPNYGKTTNKDFFTVGGHRNSVLGGVSFGKLVFKNKSRYDLLDFQEKIKYSQNTLEINRATSSMHVNPNTTIIGFDSYLLKLQNNQSSFNYDVMPVKSVEKIDQNKLIVATGNHCYIVKVDDLKIIDTIWNDRTTYAFYQNNYYYIATLSGLYLVDKNKRQTYLGNLHPVLTRRIVCMKSSGDGVLYIATADAGIIALKDDKVVGVFNEDNGLSSNSCKTLHIENNSLWVGTINGITKIDLIKKKVIIKYSTSDGLPSNIINAIFVDNTDSTVWVGSPEGLTSFKEKDITTSSMCSLVMQDIKVSNRNLAIDSNNFHFKYTDNNIQFSYVAISFRSGDDIVYSYKLDGLDNSFKTTTERILNYPTLPYGSYTLQLFATNKFGVKSKILKYSFTIETPFWKTNWFVLLTYIVGFSIMFGFVFWRYKKLQARNTEKANFIVQLAEMEQQALQAQMNPHFIFNCLNSIQQFILFKQTEKANQYLILFSRLIRITLDNSDKKNITLSGEINYLKQYLILEQLRFGDKFSYIIKKDDNIDDNEIYLPAMLLQPYVENSLRHGIRQLKDRNGELNINFSLQNDYLICVISDNGIGRAAAEKYKSNMHIEYQSKGMSLTAKRVDLLNFNNQQKISIKVIDNIDEAGNATGTTVVVEIPIV